MSQELRIKILNSCRKNEELSRRKAKINTRKLNWYLSTLTEEFLNHKRINVYESTVNIEPRGVVSFGLLCVQKHLFSSD
jgi:hypothetical protein